MISTMRIRSSYICTSSTKPTSLARPLRINPPSLCYFIMRRNPVGMSLSLLSTQSTYLLILFFLDGISSLSLQPHQERRAPSMVAEDLLAELPVNSRGRRLGLEDRRSFFRSSLVTTLGVLTTQIQSLSPRAAEAAAESSSSEGLVSASRVADLLHAVPTFTLVDRNGVPFMVVGEDAKPTGYFFTEFDEASRILQLASQSAAKSIAKAKKTKEQDAGNLVNPWKDARVSTVPLDFAATLVTKTMSGLSKGGAYFQVAPSESDVEDALAITKKDKLADGKVPLFYYKDFTVEQNGAKKSPLYFRQSELVNAYRANNNKDGGDEQPEVLVSELFAVLGKMVDPKGTDEDLKTIVFVPPKESKQKAAECIRKGGKEPPFLLGQRNLVL